MKVYLQGVDIILERFEVLQVDPNFGTFDANVIKYNRTTFAFNANSTLKKEISQDHDITVRINKSSLHLSVQS